MNWKDLLTKNPLVQKAAETLQPITHQPPANGPVLNEEQRRFVISLLGQFMTYLEIAEEFEKKYGNVPKNFKNIVSHYGRTKRWQPVIERIRTDFVTDLHSVGGTHKRVRMERRERLYEKAFQKGDVRNALIAVKHMEEEMEGTKTFNFNMTQYSRLSDQELEEKYQSILEKIKPKIINVEKEAINGKENEK